MIAPLLQMRDSSVRAGPHERPRGKMEVEEPAVTCRGVPPQGLCERSGLLRRTRDAPGAAEQQDFEDLAMERTLSTSGGERLGRSPDSKARATVGPPCGPAKVVQHAHPQWRIHRPPPLPEPPLLAKCAFPTPPSWWLLSPTPRPLRPEEPRVEGGAQKPKAPVPRLSLHLLSTARHDVELDCMLHFGGDAQGLSVQEGVGGHVVGKDAGMCHRLRTPGVDEPDHGLISVEEALAQLNVEYPTRRHPQWQTPMDDRPAKERQEAAAKVLASKRRDVARLNLASVEGPGPDWTVLFSA